MCTDTCKCVALRQEYHCKKNIFNHWNKRLPIEKWQKPTHPHKFAEKCPCIACKIWNSSEIKTRTIQKKCIYLFFCFWWITATLMIQYVCKFGWVTSLRMWFIRFSHSPRSGLTEKAGCVGNLEETFWRLLSPSRRQGSEFQDLSFFFFSETASYHCTNDLA